MKVVILAGGFGTRLSEETSIIPKPMIEIGGKPIMWHIMKLYSHYGFNDFIICLGYKGYMIKEYFSHYLLHVSDLTIDMSNNSITYHDSSADPWKVTLVDTGLDTMTGGRIKKVKKYIGENAFMLTYGDGISDINIQELVEFHKKNCKHATLTAVQPLGRFGALDIDNNNNITGFEEKPRGDNAWINGGFFVLEPQIFSLIHGDDMVWEREPLETLAKDGNLAAFKHTGFWKPMDTLREKRELEELWDSGKAPWVLWNK